MKLLITCAGRRVELVDKLSTKFDVIAVDSNENCAIHTFINQSNNNHLHFYKIPRCDEPCYIDELILICNRLKVDLLVPLYEPEFLILCQNKDRFNSIGTRLVLSDSKIIEICNNKLLMQDFFERNNIKTPPLTATPPAIVKPINGMGSTGIFKVYTDKELDAAKTLSKTPVIIQKIVSGTEYTIDTLCDFKGNVILAVPRIRVEVRDGEVSKSRISNNQTVISEVKHLIAKLNSIGNVVGPLTIQCFVTPTDDVVFIEVNPRFGGGVPLSIEASNYIELFKLIAEGIEINASLTSFEELSTCRYITSLYN